MTMLRLIKVITHTETHRNILTQTHLQRYTYTLPISVDSLPCLRDKVEMETEIASSYKDVHS